MNQQRINAEEKKKAMRQFLDMLSSGTLTARDRFGNTIEIGHRVMLKTDVDLMFDVVAITPEMDPKAPAGILNVMLTATFPMAIRAGVPYAKVHIIGQAPTPAAAEGTGADSNGNQAGRPTLVMPPGSEAGESAGAQAGDDVGDGSKPEDDPGSDR